MSRPNNGHGPSLGVGVVNDLLTPSAEPSRVVGAEDWHRYERYLGEILGAFGLDLLTPGTVDTPRRFLQAMYDATDGYDGDPSRARYRSAVSASTMRCRS